MESNSEENNSKLNKQHDNKQSSSNDKKQIKSEKSIADKSKSPKKVMKKKLGNQNMKQKKEEKEINLQSFSYEAISSNPLISTHIYNLVKCFTSNSNIPPNKLNKLEKDLYEKTVSMFSLILNSYEQKLIKTMINMDCFNKVIEVIENRNIEHKSVSCQTDISYENTE